MLERMKELATQAGSDTVDGAGRSRIQAEFSALRSEITRTVDTTVFQGNILLDGSFGSVQANQIGTSDVTVGSSAAAGTYSIAVSGNNVTLTRTGGSPQTINLADPQGAVSFAGGTATLTFGTGNAAISIDVTAESATDAAGMGAVLNGRGFTVNATSTTSTGDSPLVQNVATTGVSDGTYTLQATLTGPSTATTATNASHFTSVATTGVQDGVYSLSASYAGGDMTVQVRDAGNAVVATQVFAGYNDGDALSFSNAGFSFVLDHTHADLDTAAEIDGWLDSQTITVATTAASLQINVLDDQASTVASQTFGSYVDASAVAFSNGGFSFSLDTSDTAIDTGAKIDSWLDNRQITVATSGPAVDTGTGITGNSTERRAQFLVGASGAYNTHDLVSLDALDLRVETLGIQDADLSIADTARAALSHLDSAISHVNQALGSIGAFQNRIENAMGNLKTSIQNISAAESVIRDLDMAEEMTNFSKNQILQQAGTAMLAQANQAGQTVLQLLAG
jgi:flagellin